MNEKEFICPKCNNKTKVYVLDPATKDVESVTSMRDKIQAIVDKIGVVPLIEHLEEITASKVIRYRDENSQAMAEHWDKATNILGLAAFRMRNMDKPT